jgi:hypothetical protein
MNPANAMPNRTPGRTARSRSALLSAAALLLAWGALCGFYEPPDGTTATDSRAPHRTIRLDGRYVHNVGRVQLQMTNIGETGNQSNPRLTTVPSCEWPAGSGNDYLYAAGPWIGALDASGIPHVTTALYERELSPELQPSNPCAPVPIDQVADVREAYEGVPGGNRIISASVNPDDDGDGLIDEDFLNGVDDDGDGQCDEDYSAIGQQMLACEYIDYLPETRQAQPEHVPLGLKIQQTSYAWATPGQNDFVGIDYRIINKSGRSIRNVYVAIFSDCDIGSRGIRGYFLDDEAALMDREVSYIGSAGEVVTRRIQMGYMWDNLDNPARPQDNKGGDAPGYIGCMFLNHTTDPAGLLAPTRVGITSFKFFSGSASFAAGGDPENDAQRYQLMSDPQLNPDVVGQIQSSRPLDYRFILATGPFKQILPDSTLTISVAWVMGDGSGIPVDASQGLPYTNNPIDASTVSTGTLLANAISAQQVFDGLYSDLDGDGLTGQCGKETCLRNTQIGGRPFVYSIPDTSLCRDRFRPTPAIPGVAPWDPNVPCELHDDGKYVCQDQLGGTIANGTAHCASEDTLDVAIVSPTCFYVDMDCDVNTGQGGRENLVNWVAAAPLPAPFYLGQNGHGEVPDFREIYQTRDDSARVSAWFFPGDRKVTLKWSNFAEMVRDAQRGNLKEFIGYRIYKAAGWERPLGTNAPSRDLWSLVGEWRTDPKGTPARPLSELIDPTTPIVTINSVPVRWDPVERRVITDPGYVPVIEQDTLYAVGRYSYVDTHVLNGFPYFYSIVPLSIVPGETAATDLLLMGNPSATNAQVVYPRADAQRDQEHVYVVPNPYKGGAQWDLVPRDEDPSGTKVSFVNLPRTRGTIHIYTLAGDLVKDIPFDGTAVEDLQYGKDAVATASGTASWNLISRNGQRIVSGVYLYSVDTDLGRQVGRFVIIR